MFELSGKSALVTGGSRGLGRAIVKDLATAGAQVSFCYHKDSASAETVAEEVECCTGPQASGHSGGHNKRRG